MNSENLGVERHARKAVVALGNDAEQLAASLAVTMTGMVEWPVCSFRATTSSSVVSGERLVSETTKPALYAFTRATMAASLSMVWLP